MLMELIQSLQQGEIDWGEVSQVLRKYQGQVIVLKIGGSLLDREEVIEYLARDVVILRQAGIYPVIVNGGGKAINRALGDENPVKIAGYRVTDAKSAVIIEQVLFSLTQQIEAKIAEIQGNKALSVSICGSEAFGCLPREVFLEDGEKADLQFVGKINSVNTELVQQYLKEERIIVVSSTALGKNKQVYNCNADDAASTLASALQVKKLVFMTEAEGILDVHGTVCRELSEQQLEAMFKSGELNEQIWPKLEGVLAALQHGVGEAAVIDGRKRHPILTEILARECGVDFGTHFVK